MPPTPQIPLEIEFAAGVAIGLTLALAFGQRGTGVGPWIALGVGLGTLLAFLIERIPTR